MTLSLLIALGFAVAPCPRPAVADDAASARRIAERTIAALPPRRRRYVLRIERIGFGYTAWRAYETPEIMTGTRGGGGVAMDIDRCTGAVSNLHYQR